MQITKKIWTERRRRRDRFNYRLIKQLSSTDLRRRGNRFGNCFFLRRRHIEWIRTGHRTESLMRLRLNVWSSRCIQSILWPITLFPEQMKKKECGTAVRCLFNFESHRVKKKRVNKLPPTSLVLPPCVHSFDVCWLTDWRTLSEANISHRLPVASIVIWYNKLFALSDHN